MREELRLERERQLLVRIVGDGECLGRRDRAGLEDVDRRDRLVVHVRLRLLDLEDYVETLDHLYWTDKMVHIIMMT